MKLTLTMSVANENAAYISANECTKKERHLDYNVVEVGVSKDKRRGNNKRGKKKRWRNNLE